MACRGCRAARDFWKPPSPASLPASEISLSSLQEVESVRSPVLCVLAYPEDQSSLFTHLEIPPQEPEHGPSPCVAFVSVRSSQILRGGFDGRDAELREREQG